MSARASAALTLVALAVAPPAAYASPDALFDLGAPAPAAADEDVLPVELGVRVTTATPFRTDGIAFYRADDKPLAGARVRLWKGYQQVAIGTADATARSGWVRVAFNGGSFTMQPGTEYVASYSAPNGGYTASTNFFTAPMTSGSLGAPSNAGVYRYYDLVAPTYTWERSNYWVTPYGEALPAVEEPPPPDGGPWAAFDETTPIDNPASDDRARVELGTRFSVAAPTSGSYVVKSIRVYRGAPMPEIYVYLYDADGAVVGRGQLIGEGGRSGVNEVLLNAPVKLQPGVTYTASYDAKWGQYAEHVHGFDSARTIGPLTFPADAGVYQYGTGFPTSSWEGSDYYVTPVVSRG